VWRPCRPGGEECDDGKSIEDDGCTNACALPKCGDGIVHKGEACDDGNGDDDDTCTNTCTNTCGNNSPGTDGGSTGDSTTESETGGGADRDDTMTTTGAASSNA